MAAIVADVDTSDHPDAEAIEERLRDVFLAHGHQPPRSLTGTSRVMAAGAGRRGTLSRAEPSGGLELTRRQVLGRVMTVVGVLERGAGHCPLGDRAGRLRRPHSPALPTTRPGGRQQV
jgi:hypothetical protein